ncbi:three-helix bundle dimerization domain-containing protein [Pedococcus soli]
MSSIHEASALEQVVSQLVSKFPSVDPETVRTVVDEVYRTFDGPVRDYVPLLVQRVSTDRLRALATGSTTPASPTSSASPASPAATAPHARRTRVSA